VTSGENRTQQQLTDDEVILAAYRDHFGIVLDRVPVAAPAAGRPE
jgi:N-hydroxyarylamine O-acetyltransferase